MEKITYEWIRSHRKTSVIQIKEDGKVIVRTPYSVSRKQTERFVEERADWIQKNQEKLREASRQKTRWGSCSCKGNLNFNWKLMLMPPEILDYVVVHELAHRKEMNHSRDFWKIVEQVLPDYQERRKRLRELA